MPTKLNGAGQQQPYTEDGRYASSSSSTSSNSSSGNNNVKKLEGFGKTKRMRYTQSNVEDQFVEYLRENPIQREKDERTGRSSINAAQINDIKDNFVKSLGYNKGYVKFANDKKIDLTKAFLRASDKVQMEDYERANPKKEEVAEDLSKREYNDLENEAGQIAEKLNNSGKNKLSKEEQDKLIKRPHDLKVEMDRRWNTSEQKTKVITSKKFSNFGKKEAK